MANDSSSEFPDSLESAPLGVPYYALDTLELIGRQAELAAIDEALDAHVGRSTTDTHVIVFRGPGGVGKTRLLREAVDRARERKILNSGIIDLYHSDTHSNSGIEMAIIRGLRSAANPANRKLVRETFKPYETQRKTFETRRAQAVGFELIEKARSALREAFVSSYNALAARYPVLIVLDTAELIQFENDVIQRICQIENVAVQVKTWLTESLPQMHNTVILLAGRGPHSGLPNDPRIQLWSDLDEALERAADHDPSRFNRFELGGFSDEEGMQYFDAVVERLKQKLTSVKTKTDRRRFGFAIDRIESVPPEYRATICRSIEGRPIRLGLAIDLLIAGDDLDPLLAPSAAWNSELRNAVIERLYGTQSDANLRLVLDYLAATRYGLDAGLLHYLEPNWSPEQCQQYLNQVESLSFVKARHETNEIFLHDDMYDLMAEGVVRAQEIRFREIFKKVASYYIQMVTQSGPPQEKDLHETYQVKQVHYSLYHDPKRGFAAYAEFDHVAIEGYAFGFDMKLRDELLRFYNSDENARSAANRGLPRMVIDRDSAVRWIQRYLARYDSRQAANVAEVILQASPQTYSSILAQSQSAVTQLPDQIAEARNIVNGASPFFWGRVLTFYGEALTYFSSDFEYNRQVLDRAVDIFSIPETKDTEFPDELRLLLVGRAHNNLGYLYRLHGWYGQALDEYRHALRQFPRIDQDDRANTLNNLAYLLGLLGRIKLAKANIDEAIAIRKRIGKQYPLALSRSTLGRIYTHDEHPMWGERECRDALETFEELGEPRGLGLALVSLGFALRQRGDQWKMGVYSASEAATYFKEADAQLNKAVDIFGSQVTEPIRLWEAYNELGSLHGDWGWLDAQSHITDGAATDGDALVHYGQSIEYQERALQIAGQHKLPFQRIDSYIDLAQVYGDRSFLCWHLGRHKDAKQDRDWGDKYLNMVQSELIPNQFHLVTGSGFRPSDEPAVAYWLHLGESHMWRGVWAFRDVEYGVIKDEQREEQLRKATHQLITAAVYFQQYWPTSPHLDRTLRYLGKSLRAAAVEPEWAQNRVTDFEQKYPEVDLKVVRETIDDMIGI